MVLNLPLDVQAAEVAGSPVRPAEPPVPDVPIDAEGVGRLVDALAAARRPVFIAGRGARGAGCREALERLAERAGALLATSAVANGLFEGNPWSLGISGGFATPLAGELLRGADLVVGWGCALNMWTTSHGALIGPEAALVQVDVEPGALGRNRPISLGVVGDVRATATAAAASLPARTDVGYRSPDVADRIACRGRWRDVAVEDTSTSERIDPRVLSVALDDLLPRRACGGDRLRELHGLPQRLPRGSRRARLLHDPGVPIDRSGPGDRDRRGARPARPLGGRRTRRRRRAR